jgi:signal transduction histidine kinase
MISPTLPGWSSGPISLRVFASRVIVLVIFAGGTAFMSHRLARQEEHAKSLRSEADRFKEWSELGASISHDLRTPLTAMQATLGLLETGAADRLRQEERELLTNARRNVDRIRLQIDDLLTANQIHTGTFQMDREPIDLRDVATDALEMVRYSMDHKDQALQVDLPTPLPTIGDARRLEQVVVNLLDNAYRHTPKGSRVTVTGQVVDAEAHLVVADDGPGIPPEEHEQIFKRFYRRGHSRGSGLGLAVAQNIIELHNGRMWVASQPGCGTAFHVALPTRAGVATA